MDRARLIVYPLLLVAVIVVAVVVIGRAGGSPSVELRGSTDERQAISVSVSGNGQPQSIQTTLVGLCQNGRTYQIGWSPNAPRIPFRTRDGSFFVTETAHQQDAKGSTSATTAQTTFKLRGLAAEGDARFRTVFRFPNGRALRCDSGFVHWAANRRGNAVVVSGPPGSYPPVPSLAVNPSPDQVAFASQVDATCAQSYNAKKPLQGHLTTTTPVSELTASYHDHLDQYLEVWGLGRAPAHDALYEAWLSNMHRRVALQGDALRAQAGGNARRAATIYGEIGYLKVEGDSLGQQFGLKICTSNGSLRHMIDGP